MDAVLDWSSSFVFCPQLKPAVTHDGPYGEAHIMLRTHYLHMQFIL